VVGVSASLPPESSALPLLGPARKKAVKQANAAWKSEVIGSWRRVYAMAQYTAKEAGEQGAEDPALGEACREWSLVQADIGYRDPVAARGLISRFLARFPEHAEANFDYGRLLLSENDDRGCAYLEKSLECDSDYGPAALNLMLDHFRDAGRDLEADQVLARGRAFQEKVSTHVRFTNRLARREPLAPHDLRGRKLRALWCVLNRFPQLGEAYLAKRTAAVLKDKPVYVLAVGPRSVTARLEGRVLRAVQASMPVPCTVVSLSWWKRRLRQRMVRVCPEPVFRG
jgi:hypothetical protein